MIPPGPPERPSLEDLLATERLREHPGRPVDPRAEAAAVQQLASLLVRRPASAQRRVVEAIHRLRGGRGSVGVSALQRDADGKGVLVATHVHGVLRQADVQRVDWRASPFASCLQSRRAVLLDRPARLYPEIGRAADVCELLAAPLLGRGGKPLGVVWAASHTPSEPFGLSDAELLQRMAPYLVLSLTLMEAEAARHDLQEQVFTSSRRVAEARRLGAIFDQAPGFIAALRGPDHAFVFANRAYRRLVGRSDLAGRKVAEAFPEFVEQGFLALLDRAFITGKAVIGEGVRVNFAPDGAGVRGHYLDFVFQPVKARNGRVQGIFVEGHDVTARVVSEDRARLVSQESSHRVKNTLATVQAIAAHTARTSPDLATFVEIFETRLISLARTNDLLIAHAWTGAPLAEVLGLELALFRDKCEVAGPRVMLTPPQATAIGMIAHELVTNSSKYGAFTAPAGRASVAWRQGEDPSTVILTWSETGGPRVAAPEGVGFGTKLIHRLVTRDLHGACRFDYRPEGLFCEIEAQVGPHAPGTPGGEP